MEKKSISPRRLPKYSPGYFARKLDGVTKEGVAEILEEFFEIESANNETPERIASHLENLYTTLFDHINKPKNDSQEDDVEKAWQIDMGQFIKILNDTKSIEESKKNDVIDIFNYYVSPCGISIKSTKSLGYNRYVLEDGKTYIWMNDNGEIPKECGYESDSSQAIPKLSESGQNTDSEAITPPNGTQIEDGSGGLKEDRPQETMTPTNFPGVTVSVESMKGSVAQISRFLEENNIDEALKKANTLFKAANSWNSMKISNASHGNIGGIITQINSLIHNIEEEWRTNTSRNRRTNTSRNSTIDKDKIHYILSNVRTILKGVKRTTAPTRRAGGSDGGFWCAVIPGLAVAILSAGASSFRYPYSGSG